MYEFMCPINKNITRPLHPPSSRTLSPRKTQVTTTRTYNVPRSYSPPKTSSPLRLNSPRPNIQRPISPRPNLRPNSPRPISPKHNIHHNSPRRHHRISNTWPHYHYGWRYVDSPVIAGATFVDVYSPVPACPYDMNPVVSCVPELKQKNMTLQFDPYTNTSNIISSDPDTSDLIDIDNIPNANYYDNFSPQNPNSDKQILCKNICESKYSDTLNSPILTNPNNPDIYKCGCIVPTYQRLCDYTCDY